MIDHHSFTTAFQTAVVDSLAMAQPLIVEALPQPCRFTFAAGRNWVGPDGKVKFLGGRILAPNQLVLQPFHTACRYMWVDGKVPIWINLNVWRIEEDSTTIQIMLSKRLCGERSELMHQREGNPPFHVLSPHIPHDWRSLEEDGPFALEWWDI